jgi:hypothetical protein
MQRFGGYDGVVLKIEGDVIDSWLSDNVFPSFRVTITLDDGSTIVRSMTGDVIVKEGVKVGSRVHKGSGFFELPRRVKKRHDASR